MRWVIVAGLLLVSLGAQAQLALEVVADQLTVPIYVDAPAGDDRLFIVERRGRIKILQDGVVLPNVYLDISARVATSGEGGLLGLAFHPDFATNGRFYLNYTTNISSQFTSRVCEFRASGDPMTSNTADANYEVLLLQFAQPFTNHNGGGMAFSPFDGKLYVATGDGGSGDDPNNNAQSLNTLLGKMLRISVPGDGTFSVPDTNPFVGTPGARPEIWAYGLRNPFRFSFDRVRGSLWIGDVGQNAQEEINYQRTTSPGGENYGWRVFEGTICNIPPATQTECDTLAPNAIPPVHTYPNPADGRAVMGGYVYRGSAIAGIGGRYFFGDYAFGRVWSFAFNNGVVSDLREHTAELDPEDTLISTIGSFGEDANGEIYIIDNSGGRVMKIVGPPPSGDGEGEQPHSADVDGDFRISISELLRLIQFFNLGGYHCGTGDSNDGFAAGPGDQNCAPHQSDFKPQDWRLNLSEVLRAVQVFNSESYIPCPGAEDGICPVS